MAFFIPPGVTAPLGPVGIVIAIGTVIAELFFGLFGGSANDNIIKAFNGLRQSLIDTANKLMKFAWTIANGLAAVFNLLKFIWGNVLGPIVKAIRGIVDRISRVLNKVLKPILDGMAAQRKAILDLYTRYIRPIIVAIEKVRRIIHFFQLLHIHIFDGLDRTLAKIEGKLLTPIYRMLYRVNTLGNWINFILNLDLLLRRGLLLGSLNANRGGTFSLLAGAPPLGMTPLPQTAPLKAPVPAPVTYSDLTTVSNSYLAQVAPTLATGSSTDQLFKCFWTLPSPTIGQPVHDFLRCFFKGTPFEGMV